MIDAALIPELVSPFIQAYKDAKKGKLSYTALYNKAVQNAHAIKIHSEGEFPEELIRERAPSQTDEEFNYLKANYQSVTKSPWAKLCNSVGSVMHNVTLTVDDEAANDYLKAGYPAYSAGFLAWCTDVVSPIKCDQPMAVLVSTVAYMPESDTELPESVAVIYETEDVVQFTRDHFIGVVSRSMPVRHGNSTVYEGLEFVLLDDNIEYRYTQVGKKLDWTFELTEYYKHNLGRLPASQLKGIPQYVDRQILWTSFFENALPYLNKAAMEANTLDAIIARVAYPIRVYYQEDCDAPGCDGNGYIKDHESGKELTCQTCNGSGKKDAFNLFRDYTHKPPDRMGSDQQPTFPGMAYVAPDSDPMRFLQERNDRLIEKAGYSVNFDISSKDGQPETATKHRQDKQEQYKMLSRFASQMYDLIEKTARDLIDIRFIRNSYTITLTRQSDFEIRSPEELSEEIKAAREAGLPQYIINELIRSNALLRFSQDDYIAKLLALSEYVDPLHGTPADKVSMVASRGFQPWQISLHNQFGALVSQLLTENDGFLDLEIAEQAALIEAKARALTPQANGVQSIIDSLG